VTMHSLPKSGNDEEVKEKWNSQEEGLKNEETIAESGCIFVRNLAYTTCEADLEPLFSNYGLLPTACICVWLYILVFLQVL